MRKKRWTGMDSADSHLPFQDWRWLVTRRDADEKPIVASHNSVIARSGATAGCSRTKVTAN
jgi:hypothetical protein